MNGEQNIVTGNDQRAYRLNTSLNRHDWQNIILRF